MDISSNEPKVSACRQVILELGCFLETLLRDILFYLVLTLIALLIIFSIMKVGTLQKMDNLPNGQSHQQNNNKTNRIINCFWPGSWCRILYRCHTNEQHRYQQKEPTAAPGTTEIMANLHEEQDLKVDTLFEKISNNDDPSEKLKRKQIFS